VSNLHSSRCIGVRQSVIPLRFAQSSVAASQTSVDLAVSSVFDEAESAVDENAVVGITVPFPAVIVGVSVDLSAAASAGTLSVAPTVNGTAAAAPTVNVTTETTSKVATATRWADTLLAAGDVVGCQVTTDGDWNGTTSDLVITLWVIMDLSEYGESLV